MFELCRVHATSARRCSCMRELDTRAPGRSSRVQQFTAPSARESTVRRVLWLDPDASLSGKHALTAMMVKQMTSRIPSTVSARGVVVCRDVRLISLRKKSFFLRGMST